MHLQLRYGLLWDFRSLKLYVNLENMSIILLQFSNLKKALKATKFCVNVLLLPKVLLWALCTVTYCRVVLRATQDLLSGYLIWYCFSAWVFYRFTFKGLGKKEFCVLGYVMKDCMNQGKKWILRCTMMHEIRSSLLLERNCQWIISNDGDFTTEQSQLCIVRQVITLTASFLIIQK